MSDSLNLHYAVDMDGSIIPMSAAAIREAYRRGSINVATKVKKPGSPNWVPLAILRDEIKLPSERGAFTPLATQEKHIDEAKPSVLSLPFVLILTGILAALFFLVFYDVSVETLTGRVVNLQRMQNRTLGVSVGGFLILIGTIVALARSRNE